MRQFAGEKKTKQRPNLKAVKFIAIAIAAFFCLRLAIIPINIAVTKGQHPNPQAIFVLGSDLRRSELGIELWKKHPEMNLWVSDSAAVIAKQEKFFSEKAFPPERLRLDAKSTDTVTNFTTMVDQFQAAKIKHLYLVTSAAHMDRSVAIAHVVLGSRGIVVTPVPLKEEGNIPWFYQESGKRTWRDRLRAISWLFTGKTGASMNPRLPPNQPANQQL
jgi:uncharacterized SAM-binding protein YcdF (DUF218 family)